MKAKSTLIIACLALAFLMIVGTNEGRGAMLLGRRDCRAFRGSGDDS